MFWMQKIKKLMNGDNHTLAVFCQKQGEILNKWKIEKNCGEFDEY